MFAKKYAGSYQPFPTLDFLSTVGGARSSILERFTVLSSTVIVYKLCKHQHKNMNWSYQHG